MINLFSECLCAEYMWNQTQIFFAECITISDVTMESAILGFTDTSTKHLSVINHMLLIYKCCSQSSQYLSFLAFKNNIIKIKTLEERTSEERKFLKKQQIINNALSS